LTAIVQIIFNIGEQTVLAMFAEEVIFSLQKKLPKSYSKAAEVLWFSVNLFFRNASERMARTLQTRQRWPGS